MEHVESFSALAVYVHNMDPVLLPIWGELKVRWYGLAYLLGFFGGYLLLKHLAKRGLFVLKEDQVADFITYAAIFGVFLGGRLGYLLFYTLPERGFHVLLEDPLLLLRVWEGGMASHGGILGLTIFAFVYARRKKVSWLGLGDGLCAVVTVGLFCGRMANFINGELYGRAGQGVAWLMKFPGAFLSFNPPSPESAHFQEAMSAAVVANPEELGEAWNVYHEQLADPAVAGFAARDFLEKVQASGRSHPEVMEAVAPFLEPRHPSQLYEAFLEGALLFAILWVIRIKLPQLKHGMITGMFFILYALFRVFVEGYREPDSSWVIEDVLTKGQFYSLFMVLLGIGFLAYAARKGRTFEERPT
jgi:phosphatidylglycerol:prolipoprotein diacylglycerol transferase